jgi:hypothetical protein
VLLPPFLLLDDSYTDVESHIALLKRIGLVNAVRVIGDIAGAQRYLRECAPDRLPVLLFIGAHVRGGEAIDLVRWMRGQPGPVAGLAAIAMLPADRSRSAALDDAAALGLTVVDAPVDMHQLIAAMKGAGLAEKVRIDAATLTVQVELWPPVPADRARDDPRGEA